MKFHSPMNLSHSAITLFGLLFITSCHRERERSAELIEANRLHLEAMEIASELEMKLEKLTNQSSRPAVKVRVDSLHKLIQLWERHVVEVPGFPHAHDHAHDALEHRSVPPMTDESMLDYQQKSWEAIKELQSEAAQLEITD